MQDEKKEIILATGNPGKVPEMQGLVADLGFTVVCQADRGVPEPAETGTTFVENAIIKARNACEYTGLPAIADDSGLEVDALQGAPGLYSARFSGDGATDATNNALLLERLADVSDAQRTARFQCVIVYLRHAKDPVPLICQGSWEGKILFAAQGENGFGYDPLFEVADYLVDGQPVTSAQLPPAIKKQLSHRGQALQQFAAQLKSI